MKNKNVVLIFSVVVLLVILLVYINLKDINKFKTINKTTKVYTTTKNTQENKDYITDSNIMEINITGETELVSMKTYISYLGYQIDYMDEYFKASTVSNGVLVINSNEDSGSLLKIELLSEDDYNRDYQELTSEIVNNYKTDYYFFRGHDKYMKVTKVVNTKNINIDKKFIYMINSIYFN